MSTLRVLHVDDEPDIRELVEISLGLDPELLVKSCASGKEALAAASDWAPNLILMDVMMPIMDGPQALGHLRELASTAMIPVIFMTARAQARELAHLFSLGAAGVIPKPFDPMTLAEKVKRYLDTSILNAGELKRCFVMRARGDATTLNEFRTEVGSDPVYVYPRIEKVAHALAAAATSYNFGSVGSSASVLIRMIEDAQNGIGGPGDVERSIDRLLEAIDMDCRDTSIAKPNVRSA